MKISRRVLCAGPSRTRFGPNGSCKKGTSCLYSNKSNFWYKLKNGVVSMRWFFVFISNQGEWKKFRRTKESHQRSTRSWKSRLRKVTTISSYFYQVKLISKSYETFFCIIKVDFLFCKAIEYTISRPARPHSPKMWCSSPSATC